MVNFVKYPIVLMLIWAYMLTSISFGVHHCTTNGSVDVLLVKSDRDCSEIHNHCGCSSLDCGGEKHDGNCCETSIYHLDFGYETSRQITISKVFVADFICFTLPSLNSTTNYKFTKADVLSDTEGPPAAHYINNSLDFLKIRRL